MIDAVTVTDRNAALTRWYSNDARDLPWRVSGDPYVTLVSEAMLQQTQVERVVPKFEDFIDTWATAEDLAQAPTGHLLAVWSGLGYNSRALRLRESARIIVNNGWPESVDGLMELPGVGPYTAAAIASIAFGVDVAAVDTNLKRVLSRWYGEPLSGKQLDRFASEALASPAGRWNQAVMDLGATLCRPKNPACDSCPVSRWCVDPDVYVPPLQQSAFKGSRRQLRGALVRAAVSSSDLLTTGRSLDRTDAEIEDVINDLLDEGLIERSPSAGFVLDSD